MGYTRQFDGGIIVDKPALGDRLDECQDDFAEIWGDRGYFYDFSVEAEGKFYSFCDRLVEFVEKWGEFIEVINIEAHGEDIGDHMCYVLRDGNVVEIEGRIVYDQEGRIL